MATVTRIFQSAQYNGTNPQEVCDIANMWPNQGETYSVGSDDSESVTLARSDGFSLTVSTDQWVVSDNSWGSYFDPLTYESMFATI